MYKEKLRKLSQLFLITALIFSTFRGSFFGVHAEDNAELLPGEVTTQTTVVPSTELNVWDVTTRNEGRKPDTTLDVVLLIDTSLSMNESGGSASGTDKKITTTKKVATDFVDVLLSGSTKTNIALVFFNSEAIKHTDYTNDANSLKTVISTLAPHGESFTQDALKVAKDLVRTSTATDKVVVLISDGDATSSYDLHNKEGYFNTDDMDGTLKLVVTDDTIPESEFNYEATPLGVGSAKRYTLDEVIDGVSYAFSHNNSAVAESRFIKEAGAEIYAFGVMQLQNPQAEKMFKNIANSGNYHWARNDLSAAFDDLLAKLVSPARNLNISIPMEKGFVLNGSSKSIETSQGEAKYLNRAITWTIDNLNNPVTTDSDVFYADIKYKIKVDSQISELPTPDDELYTTTKASKLSYVDSSNTERTQDIVFDKVDPLLVTLETQLFDALGNKVSGIKPFFDVSITEGTNTPEEYNMAANAKMFVPDQARSNKYVVSVDDTKYPDYVTEYYINDEKNSDYTVPATGNRDIKIVVKNTEKALGSITIDNIAKEVDGSLSTGGTFKYEITGPKKTDDTSALEGIAGVTSENGKYFITVASNSSLNVEGLPYGEYGLIAVVNDEYSATVTPGSVTLSITEKTQKIVATHEKIDKPYSVVFNANGGEGTMGNQEFSLNEEKRANKQ